jgi:hypothetical protein
MAWYRFPYAPRAGGAYDSHHRTAGIAGRTRRRGGSVAARGAQQTRAMRPIGVLTPYPADDAEGHARLTAFAQALQSQAPSSADDAEPT